MGHLREELEPGPELVMMAPLEHKTYRQDQLTARATQISLMFFPAVALAFAAAARTQPAAEAEALILFVLLAAGTLFFGSDMISAVEIDDAGIVARPVLGFSRRMRWSDVQEITLVTLFSPLGTSRPGARVVRRGGGRPITLSGRLTPWDELVAELRLRAPTIITTQKERSRQ